MDRTDPKAPQWEGICHGWSPAALHFRQPGSCTMTYGPQNENSIHFASSDIKALLSLMQGNYSEGTKDYFAGTRCEVKKSSVSDWDKTEDAKDINPGAFHVILANRIGKANKGFVFDRTVDEEVWNQPIEGFETKVVKEVAPNKQLAAAGTAKEVEMSTVVKYVQEAEPVDEKMDENERQQFVVDIEYKYILELDAEGKIIGGRWLTEDHPDFVWSQTKAGFKGIFSDLSRIYKKSLQ